MRICIIGKFPPIQGGVSTRTYWTAHELAARGHEVHVVTNAKEARPPFRMHMRRQDWKRCEARYEPSGRGAAAGSVKVHWTDPVDRSQFYIPLASAFVSKLAGIAAHVHSEHPFDVIYSHYLEPYGIAGHLTADITGVPHVVRLAGSDAGRLWRHPQFEALYDHVLRSAAMVISTGVVAGRAIKRGVRPERIAAVGGIQLPQDLFRPEGQSLDFDALRREVEPDPELRELLWGGFDGRLPHFGIYGKLGETKGSFALLAAVQLLKQAGLEVGLVAMAHGWPALEGKFRARAEELGIADRLLQIPFLPHWRVPEFLRSCLAVCCLEQDFPIVHHAPVIAREVLTTGCCLVGSTEVIRKLPDHVRLADGYGCVAIDDVQNVDALSARLAAIARDPEPVATVAARGRAFALAASGDSTAFDRLERLLASAARRRGAAKRVRTAAEPAPETEDPRFPITQLAADKLRRAKSPPLTVPIDLPQARAVLTAAEKAIRKSDKSLRGVAAAIRLEIAIAEAEEASSEHSGEANNPMFRLRAKRWGMMEGDLGAMVPTRDPGLRVLTFDAADLSGDETAARAPRSSHVLAFGAINGERREPLFVCDNTVRILELSDGTRNAEEIAAEIEREQARGSAQTLRAIEELFVAGLLWLREGSIDQVATNRARRLKSASV